jgi:hypothetical protein
MTSLHKNFCHRERGATDDDWYAICRDDGSTELYVRHEWSYRHGDAYNGGEEELSISEYFRSNWPGQRECRALIDEIARSGSDAKQAAKAASARLM